jgi:hypothetical protein
METKNGQHHPTEDSLMLLTLLEQELERINDDMPYRGCGHSSAPYAQIRLRLTDLGNALDDSAWSTYGTGEHRGEPVIRADERIIDRLRDVRKAADKLRGAINARDAEACFFHADRAIDELYEAIKSARTVVRTSERSAA